MTHRTILALLLAAAAPALAVDRVRLIGGGSEAGDVIGSSREALTLRQSGGNREIPAVEVGSVLFEGEPPQLTQARINVANGGYETALEKLAEVSPDELDSDLAKQDLRFYTAYAKAQSALAGGGNAGKAYQELSVFVQQHGDSFHYYTAVETLGDLLAAAERYDRAERFYGVVAKAPFPVLRVRGRVLAGRVSQRQGDHAEAIRRFDAALALPAEGDSAAAEHDAALRGKAESLAATDRLDDARELIARVVDGLADDDTERLAAAYNTLGRCYESAGDSRGALLAYLHTDLVFHDDPATHAEALARLGELWRTAGEPAEARDALARLRRRYGGLRWAREAG